MPSWIFWAVFFAAGAGAVFAAKWLDDREQRRWSEERRSSGPPTATHPPPRKA